MKTTSGHTENNGNGGRKNRKALRAQKAARRWRFLHLVTGLAVGLWLLLMAATGILINHQTAWGLDEIEISNQYLPGHYTDEFHPTVTRLHVVLADLHSGRFFGERGRYIGDFAALLVFVSVVSGVAAYLYRRRANRLGVQVNGVAAPLAKQHQEPPQEVDTAAGAPQQREPERETCQVP
ncbi:MAG: PepSY-associated TM helix domain-containing protein [Terriglobia bacterium]